MKKRLISAIVMLLIFIPVLMIGGISYAILMAILAFCSLYELIKIRGKVKTLPAVVELFAYILVAFFTMNNYSTSDTFYMLDYRLMAILILVNLSPLVFINDKDKYGIDDALFLIGATLFIGLTFNLLVLLRSYSLNYVIYIFLITIFTDTFAYITGKYIGRRPLAPKISPKKTIEGTIGGSAMATIVATLFFNSVIPSSISLSMTIFMTIVLSLLGQLGDLVFSFIKREYGKKDFSNIIPGHGGILDRLDSIIFVALGFIIFITII